MALRLHRRKLLWTCCPSDGRSGRTVIARFAERHRWRLAWCSTAAARVAAVVFDDHIDVLQESARVTPEVRARLRAELSAVQARGSTALYEGWLTGCKAITSATPD